jgi:hypothetical protein
LKDRFTNESQEQLMSFFKEEKLNTEDNGEVDFKNKMDG